MTSCEQCKETEEKNKPSYLYHNGQHIKVYACNLHFWPINDELEEYSKLAPTLKKILEKLELNDK